jgi:hypothetical protein
MIKVYIETSVHAECVATIQDEWVYMALLPSLEKLALEWGGILTESVVDDTPTPEPITEVYLVMGVDRSADLWEVGSVPQLIRVCTSERKAKEIAEELRERYQRVEPDAYWEYYVTSKEIEL